MNYIIVIIAIGSGLNLLLGLINTAYHYKLEKNIGSEINLTVADLGALTTAFDLTVNSFEVAVELGGVVSNIGDDKL